VETKDPDRKKRNRELILRALTDRKFRKELEENPKGAVGKQLTEINDHELRLVVAAVRGIESQIKSIGDELLCLEPPPCGIA
jgi:hypothetical protein